VTLFAALALLATGASQASDAGHGDTHAKPAKATATKPKEAAKETAPQAAAAATAADPVERLRERLAGRLAGAKATTGSNTGGPSTSLQVVNLPPTPGAATADVLPPTRPMAAAPRPRAPASAQASPGGSHGSTKGSVHWSYSGEAGPQAWGGMKPEFSTCARGERQSPIDIREGLAVDLEPIQFRYQPSGFSVIDNGHTVQVNLAPGNSMEVGGRRYELLQFHFHRPSEERIDGRQFEMSAHLVHKDPEGRLAVVAVVLGKGPAQPVVQTVWNNLPLEKHQEMRARAQLDPAELLPSDRRYYTYMGSLTTPPCSEGVQWVVMRQPVAASPDQIELFSRLYPMNARPVQNAAGRRILQSQ
jgi:carbonic anhydrase